MKETGIRKLFLSLDTQRGEHALSQAVYQSLTILPGHIQLKLESQPLWKKLQIDFISERVPFGPSNVLNKGYTSAQKNWSFRHPRGRHWMLSTGLKMLINCSSPFDVVFALLCFQQTKPDPTLRVQQVQYSFIFRLRERGSPYLAKTLDSILFHSDLVMRKQVRRG